MLNVSTAVIQDTRIKKKDGTFALKLRITYDRKQKYYPLNISLTPEEWHKVSSPNPRKQAKETKMYCSAIEEKAIKIIREMGVFSFEEFENLYNQKPLQNRDVLSVFSFYINELNQQNRIGTAESYKCASSSFSAYLKKLKKKTLQFSEITPEWLQNYENWMIANNKSITTVGIYLRSLRSIFNLSINNGYIKSELYPFGKRKFQISASNNIKKALKIDEIQKIFEYNPTTSAREFARDIWIFSYLCNGANMADIARLRFSDITDTRITFVRTKTHRTSRISLKPVLISLIPEIKAIIGKYSGFNGTSANDYVFNVVTLKDSEEIQRKKIKQFTKVVNKHMKAIATEIGISEHITTYSARHSFATVLKRSGAPLAFISESLGHKDLKTTENYLDSFEDETRNSFQKMLLNFNERG